MNILFDLMLFISPFAIAFCVFMALRGTRIRRKPKPPVWLVSTLDNVNGPDRRWNLK